MFRALVILVAVIARVLANDQDDKNDTDEVIFKCCKELKQKPKYVEMNHECYTARPETHSSIEMCLAIKKGIATPDGKLDISKAKEEIEDEFEMEPEFVEIINKACVNGDLSKYGTPETSDAENFMRCINYEGIMRCPDVAKGAPCHGGMFRFKKSEML